MRRSPEALGASEDGGARSFDDLSLEWSTPVPSLGEELTRRGGVRGAGCLAQRRSNELRKRTGGGRPLQTVSVGPQGRDLDRRLGTRTHDLSEHSVKILFDLVYAAWTR